MKKTLVSLHNGIGDLIITFSFVDHLLQCGYCVDYETVDKNFPLLNYFFNKNVKPIQYKTANRNEYDYIVDLNNAYSLNELSHFYKDDHAKTLNRQLLMAFLFKNANIKDLPQTFNMSASFKFPKDKTNNVLLFTRSK